MDLVTHRLVIIVGVEFGAVLDYVAPSGRHFARAPRPGEERHDALGRRAPLRHELYGARARLRVRRDGVDRRVRVSQVINLLCMNPPGLRRRGSGTITKKAALLPLAFPETSIYNDFNSCTVL